MLFKVIFKRSIINWAWRKVHILLKRLFNNDLLNRFSTNLFNIR